METNLLIDQLKALAHNDDALSVSREVNELKAQFDHFIMEEERKETLRQKEAEANDEVYEAIDLKPLKDAFYEIYLIYRDRRKEQAEAKAQQENINLKEKQTLLNQLKEIVEKEENIGTAFASFKEIHEKWKSIGDIPREKRDDIQQDYSKLLEDFFYNMKIYKELKEHDLKRNYQLKLGVIEEIKQLKSLSTIKEMEGRIKALQNEWEGIGPVMNEQWETVKSAYWENVKGIYETINAFYDERRSTLAGNLTEKQALVAEIETIVNELQSLETAKHWEEKTDQILALQEKWKTIGPGPRKENEEIWQLFRGHCDRFFTSKKDFFAGLQKQFETAIQAKQKIIERANELKESQEWKATGEQLIQLQKEWKKCGFAGQKQDQKLWSAFRGACDAFFNARQKHFEEQDKLLETNLLAKQAIIQNIESYVLPTDRKQALNDLKEFTASYNAAGRVPMRDKDTVYNAYKSAIDKHYAQLKLEGVEKEKHAFQSRLENLSASADPEKAFKREKNDIRQQIESLKSEIRQYENNVGFFAKSKGAEALMKDVQSKVNAANNKIEALKRKLKMIPNE